MPSLISRRFRHRKRGTVYIVMNEAVMQIEGKNDMQPCVVYKDVVGGTTWVRLREEFLDDRFEEIRNEETPIAQLSPEARELRAWKSAKGSNRLVIHSPTRFMDPT